MRNRRTRRWRAAGGALFLLLGVGGAGSVVSSALLAEPAGATPADLYVSPSGTSSDTCTAADPCDLVTALGQAGAGTTVWFTASGTYTSAGEPDFTIPGSITGSAPLTLEASPGMSGVVLDGTTAETSYGTSILTIDTSTPVVLDGLTFEDEDTDLSAATVGSGGAIDDPTAPLTVESSTFSGNATNSSSGNGNGGAIDVGDGATSGPISLTVEGSTFSGNTAGNDGGAIDVGDGATSGPISLTVEGSTFSGNAATNHGGAIDVGDGATSGGPISLTVEGSTFSDNGSDNGVSASNGGAIDEGDRANAPVSLTVGSSTFLGSTAGIYGGAIDEGNNASASVSLDVEGSTFSGSTAGTSGGTIDAADGNTGSTGATVSATVEQSTFSATSPSGTPLVGTDGGVIDLGDFNTVSSVSIDGSGFTTASSAGGSVATDGGAVDIADNGGTAGSVSIDDSQFTSTATPDQAVVSSDGGAVDIADRGTVSSVSIDDSQFASTAVDDQAVAADGGAVDIADHGQAGTVSITGSTFTLQPGTSSPGSPGQAVAGNDGGAVDIADSGTVGTVSIDSTQFLGTPGPVPTAANFGGAVDVADQSSGQVTSSVSLDDVTATGVSAGQGGGAVAVLEGTTTASSAPITVVGSSFSLDRAVGNGGALDAGAAATADTGPVSVSDSTFEGDTAGSGGAIGAQSSAVTVRQSTFSDDVSTAGNGGALDTGSNSDVPVSVTASTLVGPPDGDSYLVNGMGTFTLAGDILDGYCNPVNGTWDDQGWNVTANASCTNGGNGDVEVASGLDVLLGSPADNGGPTETILPLAGNRAIGLIPNGTSVTVAGSPLALCPVAADQRGVPSATGSACNAGAVQQTPQTASSTASSTAGSGSGSSSGSTPPPTTVTPPPATLPPLPPSIPAGTFGTPATGTASATSATTITDTVANASATASVPADALPAGTTVSVTPVVDAAAIERVIPGGDAYVTSFAVSWQAPDGSVPTATAPVTLTIKDPSIVAGNVVYRVTATGSLVAVGVATTDGSVTITFSNDPDFVVAAAPKLVLSLKHAPVNKQAVRVSLDCTEGSTCKGTASIDVARLVLKHGKPVLVHGKKTYTHPQLAKASFAIAKGRVVALDLHLTTLGKSLLVGTKRRIVRVTLLTVVTDGARTAEPLLLRY